MARLETFFLSELTFEAGSLLFLIAQQLFKWLLISLVGRGVGILKMYELKYSIKCYVKMYTGWGTALGTNEQPIWHSIK